MPDAEPTAVGTIDPEKERAANQVDVRSGFISAEEFARRNAEIAAELFDSCTAPPSLRAVVSQVSILKRGKVSVVLHFGIEERERAVKITPEQVVEVRTV